MKTWHYLKPDNSTTTATADELPTLVANGTLTPQTMVWMEGMAGWETAARQMPELFARRGNPPPPLPPSAGRSSHEVDYEIIGDDLQMVEIELDPGETVIAEAGGMNYMEEDMTSSVPAISSR